MDQDILLHIFFFLSNSFALIGLEIFGENILTICLVRISLLKIFLNESLSSLRAGILPSCTPALLIKFSGFFYSYLQMGMLSSQP